MGKLLLLLFFLSIMTVAAQTPLISPIIVDKSNTILNGHGESLKLHDNIMSPMIIIGDSDNINPLFIVNHIIIENYILDGNKDNQSLEIWKNEDNGIRNSAIVVRGATNVIIRNCIINNARSAGICIEKGSSLITIENCTITQSAFDGIAAYDSTKCIIKNNTIRNNSYAGLSFDLKFNSNLIKDNTLSNNDIGVFMRFCDHNTFEGNKLTNRTFDFYFNKVDDDVNTIPKHFHLLNNISTLDSIARS